MFETFRKSCGELVEQVREHSKLVMGRFENLYKSDLDPLI
jgi:hypothetical protein